MPDRRSFARRLKKAGEWKIEHGSAAESNAAQSQFQRHMDLANRFTHRHEFFSCGRVDTNCSIKNRLGRARF